MSRPTDDDRISILSVRKNDLALCSVEFFLVTVVGSIYYGAFMNNWEMDALIMGIGELLKDIGLMGVSGLSYRYCSELEGGLKWLCLTGRQSGSVPDGRR